ncbi:MAG: GspMb/PilO family protein [Planctomycetota bacterium]|jgi:Tfp pilus assembly protein PilO
MRATVKKYLKTTALSWVGCFVLLGCIYFLVLSPQISTRKEVQQQLDEKQGIFNSALEAARKDTKIKMEKEITELRDNLGRFVIESEELANLVFDISQMAKEKRVSSFSIESGDEKSSSMVPNCQYLCQGRIDLSFASDFNRFATMLNALERNRPFVFVDKFSIRHAGSVNETEPQINMDLTVFVEAEQES